MMEYTVGHPKREKPLAILFDKPPIKFEKPVLPDGGPMERPVLAPTTKGIVNPDGTPKERLNGQLCL